MTHIYFTEEQEQWLRDNYEHADTYESLTVMFNERFGTARLKGQISDKCNKQMKLKRNKNLGQYRYGSGEEKKLPLGTIRKTQTGTYIKVCDTDKHISGYSAPNWLPLQQKIWEDAHGKIQEDCMVCFLDHDPNNFALENLFPVTRKVAIRMAQNKWWFNNPELTLTAILLCQLLVSMKDGGH